ncbi:MAG: HAD-IA family hydrolase [Solirubrobacteraceae bacterium]
MDRPTRSAPKDSLQVVIFDVDGTLVDSERDGHRVAFNRAFEEAGLPDRWDIERYGKLLEVTGGEHRINAYFNEHKPATGDPAQLASRLHARKTEIFTEMARQGEIEPRAGVAELLSELGHAGIRLAVATTGSAAWVHPLLERQFGAGRFEVVVTSEEAPVRKPDPSAYRIALERLSLSAGAAAAVEDSGNGLAAARSAGLACVVVVNDYTREQDFGDADLVLEGFGEAETPVSILADPHRLDPPGRLDVASLRRLVDARGEPRAVR